MINRIIFHKRNTHLLSKKILYANIHNDQELDALRLNKFNILWKNSYKKIPFYRLWKEKNLLPDRINNFEDLYRFPKLTSKIIQENKDLIINSNISGTISTGGSSGSPTIFPSSQSDIKNFYSNIFVGRGWWDIFPGEKTLLIWGHSHLFGTGFFGKVNELKRIAKDYFVKTKRLNAYDMSDEKIKLFYKNLISYKPVVVIGYTSILVKLADYILANNLNKFIRLKAIIPTAETITNFDVDIMERAFCCPVVIEYGMAEAGVIAYSYKSTNNLKILWNSFICSIRNDELHITTLDRNEFPLINYATKDIVETNDNNLFNVVNLTKVVGRSKDFYKLRNKSNTKFIIVSGIFIVHAIKTYKSILSVQVKKLPGNLLQILVVSNQIINLKNLKLFFLKQCIIDFPDLDEDVFIFKQIKMPIKSLSGKENITI